MHLNALEVGLVIISSSFHIFLLTYYNADISLICSNSCLTSASRNMSVSASLVNGSSSTTTKCTISI